MAFGPWRRRRSIFDEIFEEFERMMEDFMTGGRDNYVVFNRAEMQDYREPVTDFWETDNEVVITMELPGVDKKDIDLRITKDAVTVKVEKKSEVEKKGKEGYYSRKYELGFYKRIALPNDVDTDKAEASYNNGVLEIRIPKKKDSKGKKLNIK